MKNLAIKKVALGLFLAGYAASSAYAADLSRTTNNEIQGNAPVIYSTKNKARAVTVRITTDEQGSKVGGHDRKAQVGDFIHVFYELRDADGDLDLNGAVKDTLKVWIKTLDDKNQLVWSNVTEKLSSEIQFVSTGDEQGHLYFKITEDMAGAVTVGLQLQEKTTYGNPNTNEWLSIADIWSSADPDHNPTIDDNGPTGGGSGDPDPENPVGPIISSETTKLGIFKYNTAGVLDMSVNLASPVKPANMSDADYAKLSTPQYGDRLGAVVWQKVKGDNSDTVVPGTNDRITTASYKFTWNLSGPSSDTTGSVASTAEVTQGVYTVVGDNTNDSIALGAVNKDGSLTGAKHNSVYSIAGTKAGIQGFKLQVTAK